MKLLDVNVLVYAFRQDAPGHIQYREWLEALINQDAAFGMSDLVLSGFLRVVTHPKIFNPATPYEKALQFIHFIKTCPNCIVVAPGARHWEIFIDLCKKIKPRGNLVPDAYFAALAIESGCQWISSDRDYSHFPALDWRHPLET